MKVRKKKTTEKEYCDFCGKPLMDADSKYRVVTHGAYSIHNRCVIPMVQAGCYVGRGNKYDYISIPVKSLRKIIEYLYETEKRHLEESDEYDDEEEDNVEEHIFYTIQELDVLLDRHEEFCEYMSEAETNQLDMGERR
jgi:hypothetical protein